MVILLKTLINWCKRMLPVFLFTLNNYVISFRITKMNNKEQFKKELAELLVKYNVTVYDYNNISSVKINFHEIELIQLNYSVKCKYNNGFARTETFRIN